MKISLSIRWMPLSLFLISKAPLLEATNEECLATMPKKRDFQRFERFEMDTSDSEVYRPIRTTYMLADAVCEVAMPGDSILEVGTGNGLVAIAAKKYTPEANVTASDISPAALDTTRINARNNGVEMDALVESDLFAAFSTGSRFDIIASHPPAVPYLPGQTWEMSNGMTVATNGGMDGSDILISIVKQSKHYLNLGGALILGLPHWSNANKTLKALTANGYRYVVARREEVEFFPLARGKPSKELVNHIRELVRERYIEIDLDIDPPIAPVSIVVAWLK